MKKKSKKNKKRVYKKKKNSTNNKKLIRILWTIMALCILVLLLEGAFVIYKNVSNSNTKTYFDGNNAFIIDDNSYYVVGSNNNNEKNYEKAKLAMYSEKKEKVWEKMYNKGYNSAFFQVVSDNDSLVAVGNYEATKKEKKNGTRSALIVKYDKDGNVLFEKRFQVLGDSKFTNIKVVDDGYIVVGQSIYENMTLGFSDEGGAFVVKYDKDGKLVWKTPYGGSKSGVFNDIVVDGNYIYVVGKNYARTGVIAKYDLNGTFIKDNIYDFTDTVGLSSLVIKDGYIYVSGSKKTTDDDNDYDTDALILKYDLDLNFVDNIIYADSGMERFNKIIVDSNDNLVLVGHTAVYNKNKSTDKLNVFSYDGILAKYDLNLKELDVIQYGDKMDDYFTDVLEDGDTYLVSGYSTYADNSYLSKFIIYSKACKLVEVKS